MIPAFSEPLSWWSTSTARAATFAAGRADLLLEDGDVEGSAVWVRIA